MTIYLLFILGLVLLLVGGDFLVKGAVGLAEKLGISPLIIGLTIVALGTSAPELLISLQAALNGAGGLAVGNVVGSNIANVLLVLGVPALFATMCCADENIRPSLFFMLALTILYMVQLYSGSLGRMDGIILVIGLIAFLYQQYGIAVRQSAAQEAAEMEDYHDEIGETPTTPWVIAAFLVGGLIALPFGAQFTVDSAVEIATRWNVPQEVIGLTVIAIGTSLPELATTVSAARQGNTSVAFGNVIGSNLFNIAAIMGISATIAGDIKVPAHITGFDMWIMLAVTLFLVVMVMLRLKITRLVGLLLLSAYTVYLITTALL